MADYSLQLKTKDAGTGKARTLTLTNVNPEASSNTFKQFTQKLNQLTTNTYDETDLVIRTNLDTETPPIDTRQTPTLEVSNIPTLAQINSNNLPSGYPTISYTGDGVCYAARKSGCNFLSITMINDGAHTFYLCKEPSFGTNVTSGVIVVGAYGTENFKPIEIEVAIE